MTLDQKLGRAAVIVTTVLILTVAVTAAIATRPRADRDIEIPAGWRAASDYTLVIFGRQSCPACASSLAFHQQLARTAEARGVRVIAASTSSTEQPALFAASIGLAPDHAISATPAPKYLKSVPAIVLVTRDGQVLRKTEGALPPADERALLDFVGSLKK